MRSESKILSSSLSSHGALPSWSDLKELLQTISARAAVLCAGVGFTGLISCKRTFSPAWAICHAASDPARPPPATMMGSCFIAWNSNTVYQGRARRRADLICRALLIVADAIQENTEEVLDYFVM